MIPLFKVFTPEDLDMGAVKDILMSGKLSFGSYGQQLEQALKDYLGNPLVLTTANNNYAMLIALAVLDLREGDEVIASPMACLASNQPVLNFRAKVVWADIDPYRGALDPEDVKKRITSRTKAILHYHWGGYPGYVDEINALGMEHGIAVIDDCIESFGSEYKGNRMGGLGTDISCFSFQAVRLPNTVDGGAISFSDAKLYEKAKLMRDFGINRPTFRDRHGEISASSDIALPGYNAMMSELNSFLGLQQLKHVPELLERQRRNAAYWDRYFAGAGGRPLGNRQEVLPSYWIYSALIDDAEEKMLQLREQGYYASRVHLRNDYYSAFGRAPYPLPGVDQFEKQQLSVPSGWWANL